MTDSSPFTMITVVLFVLWAFVELGRIYTGFYGNLRESFPEMLTFVVISLISIGLLFVNLLVPGNRFALERVLVAIQLIFTILEIIMNILGIATLYKNHTNLYYLSKTNTSAKRNMENQSREDTSRRRLLPPVLPLVATDDETSSLVPRLGRPADN